MRDFPVKAAGDTFTSEEFNESIGGELENYIRNTGLTLTPFTTNQMSESATLYTGAATYFTEAGVADAYVLGSTGLFRPPSIIPEGFMAKFYAGNTNTGASTLNITSTGVKPIVRDVAGTPLQAGDIAQNNIVVVQYSNAIDSYVLVQSGSYIAGVSLSSDDITNASTVVGASVTDALNTLASTGGLDIDALPAGSPVNADLMVFSDQSDTGTEKSMTITQLSALVGGGFDIDTLPTVVPQGADFFAFADTSSIEPNESKNTIQELANLISTLTTTTPFGLKGVQAFTSGGVYNASAGISAVLVICVGGGGGGGGSTGSAGSTGGTSSFGAFCSASGGVGGNSVFQAGGGVGGTAAGGILNINGGAGAGGTGISGGGGTTNPSAGVGGSSFFGGGGRGGVNSVGSTGEAFGSGGGGGGAATNAAGGGGAGACAIDFITSGFDGTTVTIGGGGAGGGAGGAGGAGRGGAVLVLEFG